MCVIVDTCCLSLVFNSSTKYHSKFRPVLNWVVAGKGRMIYGGTKYNRELRESGRILNVVTELSRARKTIKLSNEEVDPISEALKRKFPEDEFDDEHIVALVVASRCCVVCTDDNRAISYLKRTDVFSDYQDVARPKIFRGHKTHGKLCCDDNIVGICRD